MNTAEAVESNERTIFVRWQIDHVKEWVRQHCPAWMTHRIDPDYNAEDESDREVMRILRQLIARPSGNQYHEGGGEKRTLNWILGVLSVLLVGAVGGGISVYGKVSSLETRVSEWQRSAEREGNEMRRRLDRLENRR